MANPRPGDPRYKGPAHEAVRNALGFFGGFFNQPKSQSRSSSSSRTPSRTQSRAQAPTVKLTRSELGRAQLRSKLTHKLSTASNKQVRNYRKGLRRTAKRGAA